METLVVVTKEEIPYVMMKKGKTGNAAYDGFAIDLLKVIWLIMEYILSISIVQPELTLLVALLVFSSKGEGGGGRTFWQEFVILG